MAASTAFWNNMAERYAASPIANQAAYERKIEATRALFRPDMEIFEFGCGTGSTALRHAPYVGHIRAVDFSENMIAIAHAKAEKAGITNVDFAQGDIASLPVERERYDMVMGHSILHLLADPQAAIDKRRLSGHQHRLYGLEPPGRAHADRPAGPGAGQTAAIELLFRQWPRKDATQGRVPDRPSLASGWRGGSVLHCTQATGAGLRLVDGARVLAESPPLCARQKPVIVMGAKRRPEKECR